MRTILKGSAASVVTTLFAGCGKDFWHTHRHRVRAFKVEDGIGSNGTVEVPVEYKQPQACRGFWQIETASLIDHPQEQRLIEIFGNGDGTGTIRGSVLQHRYDNARRRAAARHGRRSQR